MATESSSSQVTVSNETTPLISKENGRNDKKAEIYGLINMALSALAFSIMSLLVKVGANSFPSFEMVFARSIIQTVFALIGCAIYKTNPLGAPPVRKWLLVRGVFGTASLCFFYYSISNLPLADANVLFFLGPAMTAILAALLLGESFTPFDALCSATCVLGVILVAKPEFLFGSGQSVPNIDETHRMIAIMCACTGALMSSIAYITVRKMGKGASFMVVVFSFGFIASIISGIGMTTIQTFVWPKGFTQWSILLWVGIFAFVGQCLMVKGLQSTPAGPATLMRMNDIVFAFIFGSVFLDEYPDLFSVIGSAIIVGATVAMGWRNYKSKSKK